MSEQKGTVKPMPLEGIRVLEWTAWQAGPAAGRILGDLGADVIKIEEPTQGDPARGVSQIVGIHTFKTGRNAYFEAHNRNKRGISLNLRSEKGREIFYRLVEKSDVFLHNYRDAPATKLGIDYETLKKYNPRLIYAQAYGYGSKGPDKDLLVMDSIGVASSGMMAAASQPGAPPRTFGSAIGDQISGIMLADAVITALFVRERHGVGQKVETSMLGALISLQGHLFDMLIAGNEPQYRPRNEAIQPLWNFYQGSDGKWFVIAHLQPQRYWPNVCRALGITELENDPRFATMESRRENHTELIAIMDKIFATKPTDEWLKILRENDVTCSQIRSPREVLNDPQVLANDYITEFEHPVWGKIQTMGIPIKFSETPVRLRMPAFEHGQHTEEVLMELLGYSWEEISKLRDEGVI